MNEGPETITVKVKYDPNKDDTIEVKISPNTTVFCFEQAIKIELVKNNINDISVELLKFNGQELDNKDKTLKELGIENNSEIENENRVVLIKTLTGRTIYITCDENTTVREFLKKLEDKNPNLDYIVLMFAGTRLSRSMLDQKLLGYQIGKNNINYGTTLILVRTLAVGKSDDTVFNLNNLEESKNSNLVKVSETLETDNKESKNSNYPPFRIIVGIADLLLLAAAVATFLLYFLTTLSLSVAVPIVLSALFVVGAVLFLGWSTILPKILPKGCLKKINSGADLGKENEHKIDEEENDQKDDPEEEKEKEKEKEEEYNTL